MIDTLWSEVAERQFEDIWNKDTVQLLYIYRNFQTKTQHIDLGYASTVWTEIQRVTMCTIRYMDDVRLKLALDKFNDYCSGFPEEHLFYGCFSMDRWNYGFDLIEPAVLYTMGGRVLIKPDPIELAECMDSTREIIKEYWNGKS